MNWESLTDEDLYSLSAAERSVIYKAAVDGWFDRPGKKAVERVEELTGLQIQIERELELGSTYFQALGAADKRAFQALAERLRALPRRQKTQRPSRPLMRRAGTRTSDHPLVGYASRQAATATDSTDVITGTRESIIAMLREEMAYGSPDDTAADREALRPGLQRAIDLIEELP